LGDEGVQAASPSPVAKPGRQPSQQSQSSVRFEPADTQETVGELATMVVDYMLRPTADYFAPDASREDKQTASRFADVMAMAIDGKLGHWEDEPLTLVALVIALDQFPRTIFKGTKREFDGEQMLQRVLKRAADETRVIQDVVPMHMWFCCVALSHQEDTFSQRLGLQLWSSVKVKFAAGDPIHKFEKAFNNNAKLIEKFGRFPQRNAKLGRQNTAEEDEFLDAHAKRVAKKAASQASSAPSPDSLGSPASHKPKRVGSKISRMFSKKKQVSANLAA
jgi:uncharacterized protein (DUF924 family)